MMLIIFNPNWLQHQTKTEITYLGKLISDISEASKSQKCDLERSYVPSQKTVYSSIYLKVEDYTTENNMPIDTKWVSKNGSNLNLNFISLPVPALAGYDNAMQAGCNTAFH